MLIILILAGILALLIFLGLTKDSKQKPLKNSNKNQNVIYELEDDAVRKKRLEDNGENFIMIIATIELFISLAGAAILLYFVIDTGSFALSNGVYWGMILTSAIIAIVALFIFCVIKVFVNISRKATAIYQLLEKREYHK